MRVSQLEEQTDRQGSWVGWLIGAWYCALNSIYFNKPNLYSCDLSTAAPPLPCLLRLSFRATIVFAKRLVQTVPSQHLLAAAESTNMRVVGTVQWARHLLMSDSHHKPLPFFPSNHRRSVDKGVVSERENMLSVFTPGVERVKHLIVSLMQSQL